MRFKGYSQSNKDNKIKTFNFIMGREELELLLGACVTIRKNLPANIIQIDPTKQRLNNMIRCMNTTLIEYKKGCVAE